MKGFVLAICLFLGTTAFTYGQDQSLPIFESQSTPPQYKGGIQKLFETVKSNLRYPEKEFKEKIGGVVKVKFVVDTLGKVADLEVVQGVSENLNKEAIRVIKLLDNWEPGTMSGKKQKFSLTLPVAFKIEGN